MAMVSSCSSPTRPLAQQLLRTRGQGIAVFVQQRVHSTTVGVEATTAFVQQLLTELEAAVAVLDAERPSALELSDEQEIELGTLISAASLTIRYVTERDAMTPVLQRFRAAFQTVLRLPCWTKALLGLKMVSLMGTTRVLESFSQHVEASDVARDLQWLYKQFARRDDEDNAAFVERVNYLFRPACEQLTVAVQSHPVVQQTVYDELVPVLFELAPAFHKADVADAVAGELLSTLAIVFDLRLPSPTQSAFSLLPMPRFAQDESEIEAADEENIHILQRQDEPDESAQCATVTLPAADVVSAFAETVATWMSIRGRRQSVIAASPHICGAMAAVQMDAPRRLLCTTLLASLESLDLEKACDFEFFHSGIECVRDTGLRNAIPSGLERNIYAVLKTVMPRLQAALKCLSVQPAELRVIKATCSKTRDSLVEAFTWWIHYAACTGELAHLREEFIGSVVDKLADPRIHGDLLYVSRQFLDEPSFEAAVEAAAVPLIRAAKQLDRYSKVAASRVIAGVARVTIAAGTAIDRFVDALAGPLLSQVLDGSRKGRAGRLNAVACLLLSCTPDAGFSLDDREWVQQFIGVLLEASASQSLHSMVILDHLVRSDVRIRGFVARAAASSQELVRHIVQNSLSSWPIFTEDMDAVLLVLAILSGLLVEDQLRATIDVPAMTSTIEKLRENAQADEQSDLVDACDDVLKALACS